MRRPLATGLAVLAVLMQLVLGAATPLGVVFCVGESHAGIELASDDCCASHGGAASAAAAGFERTCCSDVPVYAATPLSEGAARVSGATVAPGVVASLPAPAASDGPVGSPAADGASPPASSFGRRSVVLRV